ncbi:MAG: transcriptional regulator [Archaeoglobales archaeon]|nr:transcriptional regulator [Archaeoglobales archaeon]
MQIVLLESVMRILKKAGFSMANLADTKPRCFDVVAKRGDELYLVKVLYNVDSLKPESAEEIKKLSRLLSAVPVIVGERFKNDFLERGVVYTRYGIPVVNLATFYDYVVENIPPLIYSAPGGYYVRIDGKKIREIREKLGISIGDMAKRLGVSRRTAKKYEEDIDTNLETAAKIEELLGTQVIKAIEFKSFVDYDLGEMEESSEKTKFDETLVHLSEIGVKVHPVKQAPFDAVSLAEDELVLTGVKPVREIKRRAMIFGEISRVTESRAAYITEKDVKVNIRSVVFILKEELGSITSAKDFISLIDEKAKGEK